MSQQKPSVAVVGLGVIGASIGLCLRRAGAASQVIGHDKSPEAGSRAKKTGAVDRTEWNLVSACEKADIVILALPFAAIRETLQAIAPYLRPGSVVFDTTTLKGPVVGWADEILPAEVHFVGLDPVLPLSTPPPGGSELGPAQGGGLEPRADLFENCLVCIVPSTRAVPDAVQLATELVTILGAKPFFLDSAEHDGLVTAAEHLPPVVALALLGTAAGEPAWKEVRKLAGVSFERGTGSLPADAASGGEEWLANRENLVRRIDAFAESLGSIRAALAEGDASALAELIERAGKERAEWLRRRTAGDWDETVRPELPKQSVLQPLFGGLWPRRRKTDAKS